MESEGLRENVEWEARRVAAAFEMKEWGTFGIVNEGVFEVSDGWYSGVEPLSGAALTWSIGIDDGMLREISLYDREEDRSLAILKLFRGYEGRFKEWRLQVYSPGHEPMARGLYRLGFEDEGVLVQLPTVTAHEKLELRLTMPREFWPQKWLDEEKVAHSGTL